MWYFKREKKEEFLQGRTITFIAKNFLFITPEYFISILNGKRGCSYTLANNIVRCANETDIEKYFDKKGE
ncbi:MAG TPA: hypothetical protein IAC14_08825 [Candidatus Scybalomonas excrementigallinarum]|nr:hypothetical protein [Candidatus Scybalomonas excrementigallinarum]